ncbi:MAG: InlB B-repeat-containing protein [Treponema sp.]|nr:InlB B-repeat-containing protein [Treponema sp.]
MITKRSHFNLSANLFLLRWNTVGVLFTFLISILFTSCFSDLKSSRTTTVSFNMSRETVQKILGNSTAGRSAAREGDDPAASDVYIDVTLFAIDKQTRTAPISPNAGISMTFEEIPVGTSVYAKAKIYRYADAEKTVKDVIYNGESSKIIVREGLNALNLRLAGAVLTVTFDSNGGSSVSSKTAATGTSIQKPADPVKPVSKTKYSRYDNYAFEGWYSDPELTKGYNFNSAVTDDTTLYAKWLKDFVFVEGGAMTDYLATDRNITISDLFVSDHEVTQAEYQAVTNTNPSHYNSYGDDLPVENISWFDAIKYCNLLSIKEDLPPCYKVNNSTNPSEWGTLDSDTVVSCNLSARGYRLPTEAEWEYIATKAERTNETLKKLAIYSETRPQKIKTTLADELYLCDILGNVAEWCFDVYLLESSITNGIPKTGPNVTPGEDNFRVIRGGAYNSSATECAKDKRKYADSETGSDSIGFRVVRTAIDAYTVVTNTVTFLTNGGSAVATQYITEGDTALRPSNPTKTGYNFATWLYGGSEFDFDTIIAQDIILEAKWNPINYTINYVLGTGATNDTNNPSTYTIETETFNLLEPTKDGFNFMGWYNEAVDPDVRITRIEKGSYGNITLTAHWTQCFVVTFDSNGGSSVSTQAVEDQSNATEPSAPTKSGYYFGGWYKEAALNNEFNFTTPITDNITLYAKWDPRSDTNYYIKHYKQKTIGTDYELAETETRQGTTDQTTTITSSDAKTYTGFNVSSTNTIQNVTITGNGEAVVNIYYDRRTFQVKYDDGVTTETISVPSAETYRYGATVNIDFTSIGTRPGYTFAGWNDGSRTYTSSGETSFIMDLSEVTLTAVWTANTNTPYTVKYYFQNVNCDPSTNPSTSDYITDTAYPATTSYGTTGNTTSVSAPSVAGFNVSTVNPIVNTTINGNGNTVVNVYYDRVKKTVTYTANRTGVSNPASQTYLYGQEISFDFSIANAVPGYDFNGWKDNNSGTVYTSTSTLTMGTSNISLIGQWQVITYTVTYHKPTGANVSGTEITSFTVNDSTRNLGSLSKNGYTWLGWYDNEGLTGDPVTTIPGGSTGNKEFWAKMPATEYTITLQNMDDVTTKGTYTLPTKYTIESPKILLPTNDDVSKVITDGVTTTTYELVLWNTQSNFYGTDVTSIPAGSTNSKTYYAKWKMVKIETTVDNAVAVLGAIENYTTGFEVKLTGSFGTTTISDIASAISARNSNGVKLSLDLSGTTDLTEIPADCFYGCYNLAGIVLPEGLETIGEGAFNMVGNNAGEAYDITIPSTVTELSLDGTNTRTLGGNFKNIFIASGNTKYNDIDGVVYSKDGTKLLAYPMYKSSDYWDSGIFEIPNTVVEINNNACSGTYLLKKVKIPSSVTKIGQAAFGNTQALEEVTIIKGAETIQGAWGIFGNNYAHLTKVEYTGTETEWENCATGWTGTFYSNTGCTSFTFTGE